MADRHTTNAYPLRLQEELKSKVEDSAKANGRSFNAEVAVRLAQSFKQEQEGSVPGLILSTMARTEMELEELYNEHVKLWTRLTQAAIQTRSLLTDLSPFLKDIPKELLEKLKRIEERINIDSDESLTFHEGTGSHSFFFRNSFRKQKYIEDLAKEFGIDSKNDLDRIDKNNSKIKKYLETLEKEFETLKPSGIFRRRIDLKMLSKEIRTDHERVINHRAGDGPSDPRLRLQTGTASPPQNEQLGLKSQKQPGLSDAGRTSSTSAEKSSLGEQRPERAVSTASPIPSGSRPLKQRIGLADAESAKAAGDRGLATSKRAKTQK